MAERVPVHVRPGRAFGLRWLDAGVLVAIFVVPLTADIPWPHLAAYWVAYALIFVVHRFIDGRHTRCAWLELDANGNLLARDGSGRGFPGRLEPGAWMWDGFCVVPVRFDWIDSPLAWPGRRRHFVVCRSRNDPEAYRRFRVSARLATAVRVP